MKFTVSLERDDIQSDGMCLIRSTILLCGLLVGKLNWAIMLVEWSRLPILYSLGTRVGTTCWEQGWVPSVGYYIQSSIGDVSHLMNAA